MNSKYAPIILFTYDRPNHLEQSLNSLKRNYLSKYSDLIIFSDNYKTFDDKNRVLEVRRIIKNIKGFKSKKIYLRKKNYGLHDNIITGINQVLKIYTKAIIVEDDLILSPFFLNFINRGLDLYEKDQNVASIHGYCYPIKKKEFKNNVFFIKGADCWGWGTWRHSWSKINLDPKFLYKEIKKKGLLKQFTFNDTYPYKRMLKDNINKKNNSWAIKWYASAFLNNMFTLYPKYSLVNNIGMDGSGVHSDKVKMYDVKISDKLNEFKKINVSENYNAKKLFEDYFRKNIEQSVYKKLFNFFSR
jgi:hypothetical protein